MYFVHICDFLISDLFRHLYIWRKLCRTSRSLGSLFLLKSGTVFIMVFYRNGVGVAGFQEQFPLLVGNKRRINNGLPVSTVFSSKRPSLLLLILCASLSLMPGRKSLFLTMEVKMDYNYLFCHTFARAQ